MHESQIEGDVLAGIPCPQSVLAGPVAVAIEGDSIAWDVQRPPRLPIADFTGFRHPVSREFAT